MHLFKPAAIKTLAGISLLTAGLMTSPAQAAVDTYLALGDSYAYGFTTVADAFNPAVENYYGLQGYVKPVGAALGATQTINLAIPGETTGSFLHGGNDNEEGNFNYPAPDTDSQATELGNVIAAQTAAGHTISDITIQLGGNDLLDAVFSDPTFAAQSFTTQEAFVQSQLQTLGTNYASILGGLAAAPALAKTQVYVIGYFDPFADLGANDPFGLDPLGHQLSGDIVQALNSTLKTDAEANGFHFVDPYAAFLHYPGNHADLSYIGDPPVDGVPNYHPKAVGYNLLAQQIEAAGAVPEASTTTSLGLLLVVGMGGVVLAARRKKKASTGA